MSQYQRIVLGGVICVISLAISLIGLTPLALLGGIIGGFLLLTGLLEYLK